MIQYIHDCQEMFKLKYGSNHHLPSGQARVRCGFMEKILTRSEPLHLAGFDLNNRKVSAIERRRTCDHRPGMFGRGVLPSLRWVRECRESPQGLGQLWSWFHRSQRKLEYRNFRIVLIADFCFRVKIWQGEAFVASPIKYYIPSTLPQEYQCGTRLYLQLLTLPLMFS